MKRQTAAKSFLDLPRVKVGVPNIDFKHHINQYIISTWQDDWNGAVANKLHSVKPVLRDWQSSYRKLKIVCLGGVSILVNFNKPWFTDTCKGIIIIIIIIIMMMHYFKKSKHQHQQ